MPDHPHDITESERWSIKHRENERRSNDRHAAEIRSLATSSHFGNEFTTPFLGGAYSPGPLPDTNDDTNPCTERRVGAGGGNPDDMPNMSTPDIERGVRLVCQVCIILLFILVVATAIASQFN